MARYGEIKCPKCGHWQIPMKYCPACGYCWAERDTYTSNESSPWMKLSFDDEETMRKFHEFMTEARE